MIETKEFLLSAKKQIGEGSDVTLTTENASAANIEAIHKGFEDTIAAIDKELAKKGEHLTAENSAVVRDSLIASAGMNIESAVAGIPSDMTNGVELTFESATGGEIKNITSINRMVAAVPNKQDEFAEAFYPTVVVDPKENSVEYVSTILAYYKSWQDGSKEKTSITELSRDRSFLLGQESKLYPVWNAENEEFLDKYNKSVIGKDTTASILVNKTVDLLDLSEDAAVVSGSKNVTRALAPQVKLTALNIGKVNDAGTALEVNAKVNVSAFSGVNAMPTPEGRKEDLQILFNPGLVGVKVSTFKDSAGAAIIPNNQSTVFFEIKFNATGNHEFGQFSPITSQISIAKITSEDGKELDASSDEYAAIADKIDGVEIRSYDLDFFLDNGDIIKEGKLLTTDNEKQKFAVPYKSPQSVQGSIAELYKESDLNKLAGLVSSTGLLASANAVDTLIKSVERTRAAVAAGNTGSLSGFGNRYITPTYLSTTLNLDSAVNNMESSNLEKSITAALVSSVKRIASKAAKLSGLKAAMAVVHQGRKLRVTVGVDSELIDYLETDANGIVPINKGLEIQFVSTTDVRMDERVIGGFTASADRNVIQPLAVGFHAHAPSVIAETSRTVGSSTVKSVTAYPKFEHHTVCNVFFEIKVNGLDNLINA